MEPASIRTPDQRVRVFVSSTLGELAPERRAVRAAVERLRLAPVMFELGARPHPPRDLYRAYLAQSHVFVGIYWQRYGWVAPGETVSGLEDEYRLAGHLPKLLYIRQPAPDREQRLTDLLRDIQADDAVSYRRFARVDELEQLVADDLSLLLSERFEVAVTRTGERPASPAAALPRPLTPTIGRDDDRRAAAARLRGGARLVTLTGAGGIGKSRLALEVAEAVRAEYPDGVHFVPLAAITEPRLVAPAIAERLGVRVEGTRGPFDAVADHFATRRALLVLDNLEQVSAVGPELAALLERTPGLAVLATSRHPLRVRGEQEHLVGPLAVPAATATFEEIGGAPACALFVARARDVDAAFALTEDNAGDIAELCRRLDGLPLALELAAARVRLLRPAVLLRRIGDHLDLESGRADLPERQRTLRATIDWSHGFLDAAERSLFARFSVFADGATLDAVERVCGEPDDPALLDALAGLLDKSLLAHADDPRGAEPRLRMLETVRAYAWEQLVARGEVSELRRRHLDHFRRLGGRAQPHLCGPGQRDWCERLDPEQANIRAAVDAALESGDVAAALQLTWDTFVFYYIRDAFVEPRGWIDRIAARRRDLDDAGRAKLDVGLAITDATPEGVDVRDLLIAAMPVLRAHALRLELAVAQFYLGLAQWQAGDADAAVAALQASARGYASIDHDWGVATAETTLGAILTATGSDMAARHHERALQRARAIDNRPLMVQALQGLATLDALADRTDDALARIEEAARMTRSEGWASGASYCLDALAVLLVRSGDVEGAMGVLGDSERVRTRLGTPPWTAFDHVVRPLVGAARAGRPAAVPAARHDDDRRRDPFALLEATLGALRPAGAVSPVDEGTPVTR